MFNGNLERSQDEYDLAARGMRRPVVTVLRAGEVVYRFASSRSVRSGKAIPSEKWARGPWWVREKEFRKIVERYWASPFGLGTAGREALAVMPSWSFMDVGIRARVVTPIKAYASPGSTQYRDQLPNGMTVTMGGWPDVEQLYIPGLKSEAFAALKVEEQELVSTDGFGF